MSKRKRFAGDASVCATARGECACHTMRRRSSEICTRRSCVAALALVGPFASPAALRASVRRSHVSRGDGVTSSFIVIRMPSSHAVSPPQSRSASRRRAESAPAEDGLQLYGRVGRDLLPLQQLVGAPADALPPPSASPRALALALVLALRQRPPAGEGEEGREGRGAGERGGEGRGERHGWHTATLQTR